MQTETTRGMFMGMGNCGRLMIIGGDCVFTCRYHVTDIANSVMRHMERKEIAIIGAGPAGLMAADVLCAYGHAVTVYDAMPTVGRKLLLAGKSGLNITHSEDYGRFAERFGEAAGRLRDALDAFSPNDVRAWA